MRSKARARKLAKSDVDVVNNMYDPDPDLLAGESAEDETEDSVLSPIPTGPPSPFPTSEDFTPKEGSPYEAPVYIPEDIPIPPDFELRESSVPGAGLGIWAKKKMEVGRRLGPYTVAAQTTLKETDFGWEQILTDSEMSSQEGCIRKMRRDSWLRNISSKPSSKQNLHRKCTCHRPKVHTQRRRHSSALMLQVPAPASRTRSRNDAPNL